MPPSTDACIELEAETELRADGEATRTVIDPPTLGGINEAVCVVAAPTNRAPGAKCIGEVATRGVE